MTDNCPSVQQPDPLAHILSFVDPIAIGTYLLRRGYTTDTELAIILDIIQDQEVSPNTRLGAINMLTNRIHKSLELSSTLVQQRITGTEGDLRLEETRVHRALGNIQRTLLGDGTHASPLSASQDIPGEHKPPSPGIPEKDSDPPGGTPDEGHVAGGSGNDNRPLPGAAFSDDGWTVCDPSGSGDGGRPFPDPDIDGPDPDAGFDSAGGETHSEEDTASPTSEAGGVPPAVSPGTLDGRVEEGPAS